MCQAATLCVAGCNPMCPDCNPTCPGRDPMCQAATLCVAGCRALHCGRCQRRWRALTLRVPGKFQDLSAPLHPLLTMLRPLSCTPSPCYLPSACRLPLLRTPSPQHAAFPSSGHLRTARRRRGHGQRGIAARLPHLSLSRGGGRHRLGHLRRGQRGAGPAGRQAAAFRGGSDQRGLPTPAALALVRARPHSRARQEGQGCCGEDS